ncbi:MAG TPA: 2-phospho-L-lactate guanylyltransferase [Ktedonobacterales bacterium]|jgi:2-phospho-L-lactate guanylyltransferase
MKLAAIVPLNSRSQAKTRLAGVLESAERAAISRWLAQRVLGALRNARIASVGVVSPDDEVLRWAWQHGAQPVRQEGSGLNDALDIGRTWAKRRHADALMVVLGDLPLLTADDVLALVSQAADTPETPSVTMAPDRADHGTNILLLRPPDALPFAFGEDSLARHTALARTAGIEPHILRLSGAAFDVDTPDDLRELAERGVWRPSSTYSHRWAGEAS